MIRPLLSNLLFAMALAACTLATAEPIIAVAVIDRDANQWLPEHAWHGDRWVAGIPGHRYAVRLTNTSGERVLAVLSVDGVNAVSGEDADPSQDGYVLGPWESAEITGWRKSLDDVAQFAFTALPDSYAARTGRPDNVGVIGVAAFRERQVVIERPYDLDRTASAERGDAASKSTGAPTTQPSAAVAPAAELASADDSATRRIGTAHGAREWSKVDETTFDRASSSPTQVVQLRYDTQERLVALGVMPRQQSWWSQRGGDRPQAFPVGFVADPPPR